MNFSRKLLEAKENFKDIDKNKIVANQRYFCVHDDDKSKYLVIYHSFQFFMILRKDKNKFNIVGER